MILPQIITVIFILVIGLASFIFMNPLFNMVSEAFSIPSTDIFSMPAISSLTKISILGGIFVLLTAAILLYRYYHLKSRIVSAGPVWGCGYTAGSHRQQYTSTSYSYNYNHLASPVLRTKKIMDDIREEEIFPEVKTYEQHSDDSFKKVLIDKPVDWFSSLLKKIAVMQTGEIRHYILYAFIFMLLILILTIFNII